jgi:hypothetical protein
MTRCARAMAETVERWRPSAIEPQVLWRPRLSGGPCTAFIEGICCEKIRGCSYKEDDPSCSMSNMPETTGFCSTTELPIGAFRNAKNRALMPSSR